MGHKIDFNKFWKNQNIQFKLKERKRKKDKNEDLT